MRAGGLLLLVLSLTLPLAALPAGVGAAGVITETISVTTADGSTVTGLLVYPDSGSPRDLVVVAHGYGHSVHISWVSHMQEIASHGAVAVGVDYRDNLGFPVLRGAQDTIAGRQYALQRFPALQHIILFSVSMGSAIGGTAIAEAPDRPGGGPLFDDWVNAEGVSMPAETWAEAKAIGHPAAGHIERDAGGSPADVPGEYVRRSPALRATEMSAKGLKTAVLIHSVNDGLVPHNQGRELSAALTAAGVSNSFITVLRTDHSDLGTTGTKALLTPAGLGGSDPNDSHLRLAGHASEADRNHPVMAAAFDAVYDYFDYVGPGLHDEAVLNDLP